MELHPPARLSVDPRSVAQEYVDRLPLPLERKRFILERVRAADNPARAMAELHRLLAGDLPGETAAAPADASVRTRVELADPGSGATCVSRVLAVDSSGRARLATTPRVRRTPMAPSAPLAPLRTRVWSAVRRRGSPRPGRDLELRELAPNIRPWRLVGTLRRTVLLSLVLGQMAAAAYFMTAVLPYHGERPLELAILVLFTILFGWVSMGLWTGVAGFLVLLTRRDRYAVTRSLARAGEIPRDARTAVVMPIANEHARRVFAGLRATYTSLARTGTLERFDFFVLSDSSDADVRATETMAWLDLCCAIDGFGRIFYRWRRHRIKRKSGNVADFCRRWGSQYKYMVVLDADSVMSGDCLTALVRMMEANPTTGIIQSVPRAARRETLHARIQQFATSVYGPVFTAGINYWQLGESYYWGHNAIIRVAPFMRHCALARLPGRGALSGEILSHDFVEAALMRRAGWAVWIAYDLPGSYEEVPPTLDDELKRDRRWCRGNLINSRLFLAKGLHPSHRAVFMAGILSYVSAPLWLLSLVLSTAAVVLWAVTPPRYFFQPRQLFPIWPEWHRGWAIGLIAATAAVLFLPKLLGGLMALARARDFGGSVRLFSSLLLEIVTSALLAPVRMLFHTLFVVAALTGWRVEWKSPPRDDTATSWGTALRRYGIPTLLGVAWAVGVYQVAPAFLWWLLPVVGAFAVSIPASVYSSRRSLGRSLRRAGLFTIPEELRPPLELRLVRRYLNRSARSPRLADAVLDPVVNAAACAVAVPHPSERPALLSARGRLVTTALRGGPAALSDRDRMLLLSDPIALSQLHLEVWASPAARARWRAEQALV
jgi:membrane glycosyltransferase